MDFTFTVPERRFLPEGLYTNIVDTLMPLVGKKVLLSIKEAPKPTRPNKRRYYFGVIVRNVCQALREAGNCMDEEETHIFLKREVGKLRKAVVLPSGEVKYTLRSYRDLTPKEESEYITACVAWGTSMGIDIPLPTTEK